MQSYTLSLGKGSSHSLIQERGTHVHVHVSGHQHTTILVFAFSLPPLVCPLLFLPPPPPGTNHYIIITSSLLHHNNAPFLGLSRTVLRPPPPHPQTLTSSRLDPRLPLRRKQLSRSDRAKVEVHRFPWARGLHHVTPQHSPQTRPPGLQRGQSHDQSMQESRVSSRQGKAGVPCTLAYSILHFVY